MASCLYVRDWQLALGCALLYAHVCVCIFVQMLQNERERVCLYYCPTPLLYRIKVTWPRIVRLIFFLLKFPFIFIFVFAQFIILHFISIKNLFIFGKSSTNYPVIGELAGVKAVELHSTEQKNLTSEFQ